MKISEAILLGVVQGLTEFLPVSSSGHLVLLQHYFHLPGSQLTFDILLHFGTLLAVIAVFHKEIREVMEEIRHFIGRLRSRQPIQTPNPGSAYPWTVILILAATLPTGLIGVLFADFFEELFSTPRYVGPALLVTGTLLWLTRKASPSRTTTRQMRLTDAFLIGLSQGVAIIPGISRSGATISTGLFLGLNGPLAAQFSFLISIPAILGAVVLKAPELSSLGPQELAPILWGTLVAALVGFLSLKLLLKVLTRGNLSWFSLYCWVVGGLALWLA